MILTDTPGGRGGAEGGGAVRIRGRRERGEAMRFSFLFLFFSERTKLFAVSTFKMPDSPCSLAPKIREETSKLCLR